jgi:Dullard-like phosphatase family protein
MFGFGGSFGLSHTSHAWTSHTKTYVPRSDRPRRPRITVAKQHHKTLVLDMDETLIGQSSHSITSQVPLINFDGLFIYKRPHVDTFLSAVRDLFDLFIFTASERPYADPILNNLCPFIDFQHRLYGPSVEEVDGKFRKDLTLFNRGLNKVFMIDDNKGVHSFFPENVILVKPWNGDLDFNDTQLLDILPVVQRCAAIPDVRAIIRKLAKAI